MDLSKIPTEDLLALRAGDLTRVSTSTLQMLRGGPTESVPEQAGFVAGLKSGAERTVGNVADTFQAFTDPAAAATSSEERNKRLAQEYGTTLSLDRVKQAYDNSGIMSAGKEALSQLPGFVGEQIPTIAKLAAGVKAGALLGGLGGPAAPVTVPVGALLGGVLAGATDFVAPNLAEQRDAGVADADLSLAKAGGTALGQGALSAAGGAATVGRSLLGKLIGQNLDEVPKEVAEQIAREGLLKSIAKGGAAGIGTSVAVEVPTEVAQQALTFLQAGKDLTSDEALSAYAESAYGGLLGGSLGAPGGVIDRRARMEPEVATAGPTEAERRKQNKLAQEQAEAARVAEENAALQARMDAAREAREQAKLQREQQKSELEQTVAAIKESSDANTLLAQRNELSREDTPQSKQVVSAINRRLKEIVNEKVRAPSVQAVPEEVSAAVSPTQIAREEKKAAMSAFAQPEPQQMEIRETVGLPERPATPAPKEDLDQPTIRPRKDRAQMALPFDTPKKPVEVYREALIEQSDFDKGLAPDKPVRLADIARAVKQDMDARPGRVNQLFGKTNLPKLLETFVGKTPAEIAAMGQPKGIPLSDIIFGELTKTVPKPEVSDARVEAGVEPAVNNQQKAPKIGADGADVSPDSMQRGDQGPLFEQPATGGVGPGVRDTGDADGRESVQPGALGERNAVQEPSPAQVPARNQSKTGQQVGEEIPRQEKATKKGSPKAQIVAEDPATLWDEGFDVRGTPFNTLPKEQQDLWAEAVAAGVATDDRYNEIVDRVKKNERAEKSAPRQAEPEDDPDAFLNRKEEAAKAEKERKAAQNRARQAEKKAAAAEKARLKAEKEAQKEADKIRSEEKARVEAEEKARVEAEEKARVEAEEKARVESEQEAERQAIVRMQAEEAAERARKNLEKAEAAQRQANEDRAALDAITDPVVPEGATALERRVIEAFQPTKEATRIYQQVRGLDAPGLADWLVANAPTEFDRVVASKVRDRIKGMLDTGGELPVVIHAGGSRPLYMADSRGQVKWSLVKGVFAASVHFNGPVVTASGVVQAGYPTGMNYQTLLHEMVHAATMYQTLILKRGKSSKYNELGDLANFVIKEINKENKKPNPNPFTKAIQEGQINALSNPDELLAWGLTNRDAQEYLASLDMGEKTAWDTLIDWVLDMLGLNRSYKSALSELLRISDSMFEVAPTQIVNEFNTDVGLNASIKGTTPSVLVNRPTTVEAQADVEATQEITGRTEPYYPQEKSVVADVKEYWKGGSKVDVFRNKFVDQAASVARKFSDLYSKGFKDTFGNLSPMGLYRQAQAAPQLIQSMLRTGGVRYSAERGQYETTKVILDNPTSSLPAGTEVHADMILSKIKEMANTYGIGAKQAELLVDSTLKGLHVKSLMKKNEGLEEAAQGLEAKGNKRLANDVREKMVKFTPTEEALVAPAEAYLEKYDEIRQIKDIMNALRFHAIDQAIDAGVLSKEQGKEWKDVMDYVPFDRIRDQDEAQSKRKMTARGLVAFSPLPSLKGSDFREVGNIVNNYFNMLGWMTSQTMRNKAAVKVLEDMRLADFARTVKDPKAADNENAVVRVFDGGEDKFYELADEVDVAAFDSLPVAHGAILNAFQKATRLLRTMVTAMPPFAISQVIQDAQRVAVFSGTKQPFKAMGRTLVNFPTFLLYNALGKKHKLVQELEKIGVVGAYDLNVLNPTEEARIEAGLEKMPTWKSVVRALDKITTTSDLAARAAVYQTILEDSGQDTARAAQAARELINFRRRGTSEIVSWGVAAIPFFNAYIQGMDNIYRSIKGVDAPSALEKNTARAKFFKSMAGALAIGTAYALIMSGNDEYEEAEDYLKDRAWLLPGGVRIPMPAELGVVFKVLPERIVQYFRREGTEEEQRILTAVTSYFKDSVWNAYSSPNVTPQLAKPIVEWVTNYSFFTGREIVPGSLKDKEAFLQVGANTSEPARIIGQQLGLSPMKVENFIAGVFGMAGSMAMQFGDAMLTDRGDRPLYKMPLLSTFSYDTIGGKPRTEFYNLAEKINRVKTTYDELSKTNPEQAIAYLEKGNNAQLYSASGWREARLEQVSRLRAMRKFIEADKTMSGDEKRQQLDALRIVEQQLNSDVREMARYLREN